MQDKLFLIGIGLIFLGMFVAIIVAILSSSGKIEYGFGGFIGPIPFGAWSDKKMFYIIIGFLLLFLILLLFQRKIFLP